MRLTDVCAEEDLKEGTNEIVDALHISTGGMPNGPNIQYAFKSLRIRIRNCVDGRDVVDLLVAK